MLASLIDNLQRLSRHPVFPQHGIRATHANDSEQCDETKPSCGDCSRHNVTCGYANVSATNTQQRAFDEHEPNVAFTASPLTNGALASGPDHTLELRLMHEWTAYTCKTFSTAWEFWCYRAPNIGLDFRYVLDAMLAMAALHSSRRPPSQWIPSEGRSEFSNVDGGTTCPWY